MALSEGPRWRVFLSHTSELRRYPSGEGGSYVAAVERAVSAAGHVIVDMADFPAVNAAPAEVCIERVKGCEVYVGVLGTRYGSPVRDRPDVSYTELEFDTATEAGIPRLMFSLDTGAMSVGIPPDALIDRQYGDRQEAFRQRVKDARLTAQEFRNPDQLRGVVERSLQELADTERRIASGIEREQQPAERPPVRETKFVNPPPMTAPSWFQDRHVETGLLGELLADPAMRLITVVGRGGIGKTAMVCRLLKGLESGRITDVPDPLAAMSVDGIVYLSPVGRHQVNFPNLFGDLSRLAAGDVADRLDAMHRDSHNTPEQLMLALLEVFAGGPVVVLLDNLESVMDAEHETLTDAAFHDALVTVLRGPEHAVKVIITTRVAPTDLLKVAAAHQHVLRLDEGLDSRDAKHVLRALDPGGTLGLRDAPDDLLGVAVEHTRGFPRALEAIKAILASDRSITLPELLDQTRNVASDEVVDVLVGEAFQRLDAPGQQIMQALAVYPTPVSAVGVDYLLQPHNPTINAAPILTRLVNRELARRDAGLYYLHPIDRAYAGRQIPLGQPDDRAPTYSLPALRARAADYYTQTRSQRETWRSIDDLRPQLAEFDLRCDNSDYDTAATVLADIEFDYLQVWGHYRTLIKLHSRIHNHLTDPTLQSGHLTGLGICHYSLGDYRKARDLHEQALEIDRDLADPQGEAADLSNLGNCFQALGDYPEAIDLYEEALAIAQDIGDRQGEAAYLSGLGSCHLFLGDYPEAIDLYEEALAITRDIGDRRGEAVDLSGLGGCHQDLGDYPEAIGVYEQALAIARDIGSRQAEAADLSGLGSCHQDLGDYPEAIDVYEEALAITRDIGDRYVEAKVLTGLGRVGLATGDSERALSLFKEAVRIADATKDNKPAVMARTGLATAHLEAGDLSAAMAAAEAARQINYPLEQATVRLLKGITLVGLSRHAEARRAFNEAVAAADDLIAKAANNIDALDTRGLALYGLAVMGDLTQAPPAAETFNRARAITTAPGTVAEVTRLFDVLATHDNTGVLAEVREAVGDH